jgi:hypothetical protein
MRNRGRGHSPILRKASKNPERFEDAEVGSRLHRLVNLVHMVALPCKSRWQLRGRLGRFLARFRTCLALVDSSREAALLYRLGGLVVRLAAQERPLGVLDVRERLQRKGPHTLLKAAAKTLIRGSVATRRLRLKDHLSWVSKSWDHQDQFVRLS